MTRFTVTTIRSGQPRPYADTEREYLIQVEASFQIRKTDPPEGTEWKPWLIGGPTPDPVWFQKWCDNVVKGVCQNFYRAPDEPGCDWASPMLKWMRTDYIKGTIHVFITECYTD
jgi:hypothetical protein